MASRQSTPLSKWVLAAGVVLAAFGGGFIAAGATLYAAMKRANSRRQAFAATIAELEEDLRQLRAAADNAQKGS